MWHQKCPEKKKVIMKNLMISASGIRGIIGETLGPELALKIAYAFSNFLAEGPVVLGGDTRTSYHLLFSAVSAGLISKGRTVIDIGQVPTPTAQQMISHHHAAGAIVITASHNPVIWNGLKLMNSSGSFLEEEEFQHFLHEFEKESHDTLKPWDKLGHVIKEPKAISYHIQKILSVLPVQGLIQSANLRVLVDANHGTAAIADPLLFEALGVRYTLLGKTPDGRFSHTPEPNKENLSELIDAMSSGQYDIGFAQDPDADRLVIVDEKGRFIGEDYSLAFCMDYLLSKEEKNNHPVVVNLSTSYIVSDIAKKYDRQVHYTRIGETNVTKGIKQHQAPVGGEGNGGVIYPKIGWGRDSLVGIVCALAFLAENKKTVSQIVSTYPQYTLVREKKQLEKREDIQHYLNHIQEVFQGHPMDTQDGIKVLLDRSWLHVRASNTEPIIRFFAEAPTEKEAKLLIEKVHDKLS